MAKKVFSLFFSILLIEMVIFILILPGCKGRSPILPIVPPGDNNYKQGSPNDGSERSSFESHPFVSLVRSGPAEYLVSELDPPHITEARPIFSARVEGSVSQLSSDNFIATIGEESVPRTYEGMTREVRFAPISALEDSVHYARLFFKNPDGPPIDMNWNFTIETTIPEIDIVMWNDVEKSALVIFDRLIEPSDLKDAARWGFNGENDITRSEISLAGRNMAILPLTNVAYDTYLTNRPLTIVFNHRNGPVYYVVNRGGMARTGQLNPVRCPCRSITIQFPRELHELEAGDESYAFVYTVSNPNRCNIRMQFGWSGIPIKNDQPGNGWQYNDCSYFDDTEDSLCEDVVSGFGGYSWYFDDAYRIDTIKLDRLYKHEAAIGFYADCDGDGQMDDSVGGKPFIFNESFDCTNPIFEHEPEVLYGDEVAERLLELTADWDFIGEYNPDNEKYCYSMTRAQFQEYYIDWYNSYPCDLFIVAEASDMVTSLRGNIKQIVYDVKHSGSQTYCEFGNPNQDASVGLVYDVRPWAGRIGISQSVENTELIFDWPDPDYCYEPPGEPQCTVWHDWVAQEGMIEIFPLTNILAGYDDIVDIRIRITDSAYDPIAMQTPGNWRRSDNVLDQLVGSRGGQRAGAAPLSPDHFWLTLKFIGNNPWDTCDVGEQWKIYNYSDDTDDWKTSFISQRNQNGVTELYLFILSETDVKFDSGLTWEEVLSYFPTSIEVQIESLEDTTKDKQVKALAVREDLIAWPNLLPTEPDEALTWDRVEDLFEHFELIDDICIHVFYYTKITITDNADSQDASAENAVPTLFVSSRDSLLGHVGDSSFTNMMDFAQSISPDGQFDKHEDFNSYGKRRGQGDGNQTPNPENKEWFGYDEYIVNGGLEVVRPRIEELVGQGYHIIDIRPNVPVQSEADVMLVHAHGAVQFLTCSYCGYEAYFQLPVAGAMRYVPHYRPNYFGSTDEWKANAEFFLATNERGYFQLSPLENIRMYPDFGNSNNYDWGDFWLKKGSNELRWLALFTCDNLNDLQTKSCKKYIETDRPQGFPDNFRPDKNWKWVIENGYLQSVCGFQDTVPGNAFGDSDYIKLYERNLREIITGSGTGRTNYHYSSSNPVWRTEAFWKDKTKDPSVAAWMETACELVGYPEGLAQHFGQKLESARAIAKDGGVYVWFLGKADNEYEFSGHSYDKKIFKNSL